LVGTLDIHLHVWHRQLDERIPIKPYHSRLSTSLKAIYQTPLLGTGLPKISRCNSSCVAREIFCHTSPKIERMLPNAWPCMRHLHRGFNCCQHHIRTIISGRRLKASFSAVDESANVRGRLLSRQHVWTILPIICCNWYNNPCTLRNGYLMNDFLEARSDWLR